MYAYDADTGYFALQLMIFLAALFLTVLAVV